jgi:hypothetical protein
MRAHFTGRLRVEIRTDERGASAIYVRGDESIRETPITGDPAAARQLADDIVREAYPHTCTGAECGPWVAMGPAKK